MSSKLEDSFAEYWRSHYQGAPSPIPQYMFHEDRNWAFDFIWLDHMVALDIQGGTFVRGKHARGAAMAKDYQKMNNAVLMGWRVFQADTSMLTLKNIPAICDQIASIVCGASMTADFDRSRWIAMIRNLKPSASVKWHGIGVQCIGVSKYVVKYESESVEFKKIKKEPIAQVRNRVLEHVLGLK